MINEGGSQYFWKRKVQLSQGSTSPLPGTAARWEQFPSRSRNSGRQAQPTFPTSRAKQPRTAEPGRLWEGEAPLPLS